VRRPAAPVRHKAPSTTRLGRQQQFRALPALSGGCHCYLPPFPLAGSGTGCAFVCAAAAPACAPRTVARWPRPHHLPSPVPNCGRGRGPPTLCARVSSLMALRPAGTCCVSSFHPGAHGLPPSVVPRGVPAVPQSQPSSTAACPRIASAASSIPSTATARASACAEVTHRCLAGGTHLEEPTGQEHHTPTGRIITSGRLATPMARPHPYGLPVRAHL
jgi:hypothetical protein